MNAADTSTKESDDERNEHEFVGASNDDDDPGLATKPSGVEVMTTLVGEDYCVISPHNSCQSTGQSN